MLALIRAAPVLATLISIAGSLSGAWLWNEIIDNPQVRRLVQVEERAACTIRTQEAAATAERDERARQAAASSKALREFQERAAARERLHTEVQDNLEREIAENEARLAAAGRSCLADDADVDWVLR